MALSTKAAQLLLKLLSLAAGGFLIAAGCIGAVSVALGSGLVYFVGSIYAVIFGLVVLICEIKDALPLVSALYGLFDLYLRFLTVQRGKGCFYLGVGILICFMRPTSTWAGAFSVWGVNNVAALVLALVGAAHLFRIVAEAAPSPPAPSEEAPPALDNPFLPAASAGRSEWTDVVQGRASATATAPPPRPTGSAGSAVESAQRASWSERVQGAGGPTVVI